MAPGCARCERQIVEQFLELRLVGVAERHQAPAHLARFAGEIGRQFADDDAGVIAAVEQYREVRDHGGTEPLPGAVGDGEGFQDGVGNAANSLLVHGDQNIRLGRKIIIHRARLHPRHGGDIAHRGGGIALLAEKPRGGVEQLRAAVVAALDIGFDLAGGFGHGMRGISVKTGYLTNIC